ncbi:hypothetical protein R83H12_01212 [Fibrobacteria bacterium R8-3-H12]
MKKILLLAFFWAQIISCGMGTIEAQPEATKLKIQNRSTIDLSEVKWNGYSFGNIDAGDFSKDIDVSEGQGFVSFKVAGKKYSTCGTALAKAEKHKHNNFTLGSSTPLENSANSCTDITLGQIGDKSNAD